MNILKQLSEEIFDFSKNSITSLKTQELKGTMTKEFGSIFDLCDFVIDMHITNPQSIKPSLIKVTLKTLSAFMSWIPLGYIFETQLMMKLIENLLAENTFRVETIKCLTEIAGLRGPAKLEKNYEETSLMMFIKIIEKMEQIINGVVLNEEYHKIAAKQISGFESFCLQFGLLLSTFLQHHIDLIETTCANPSANQEAIQVLVAKTKQSLNYILQLSEVPNDEIFKVCVEFWNFLANRVYSAVASENLTVYGQTGKSCQKQK
jgi:exportin-1